MNKLDNKNLSKGPENVIFAVWHNISKQTGVKKSVTYREITIAIGVLVAMVIALTLWSRQAGETLSGSDSRTTFPATAKYLLQPALDVFSSVRSLRID